MKSKFFFVLTAALLLPFPSTAFLIDDNKIIQYWEGDTFINITPMEESQRRGTTEAFAQGVGSILIENQKHASISTAVLIAPSLLLTCAHSLQERDTAAKISFEVKINGDSHKRKITDIFLPKDPLFEETGDIAIVKLNQPIHMMSYLPITPLATHQMILEGGNDNKAEFIGVSAGALRKNGDPSHSTFCRHVGMFHLKKPSFLGSLISLFRLPDTYNHADYTFPSHHSNFVPIFDYEYQQTQFPLKGGLHGCLQAGDSGSPLLKSFNGKLYIVGVASGQTLDEAFDSTTTSHYRPGDSFENHWTPAYKYGSAIQDILQCHNALDYQPDFKPSPRLS
ncbi:hypothetical protein [Candidatus Odyssella acanthamoebae]|uniref:Peptidase S1 domain-containing protein n=1 Tax=Candidatus Odyssella acanthamoebae TaxID=91604 RepID=A0A077AWK9_9PROT|nr:hypothetical protein [Candidatus Paracaedibacter acanthamoebae]AIK96846.1 hypothetical protein ID47_09040 [Candidatus Paracaedibacter acanthamoebae]